MDAEQAYQGLAEGSLEADQLAAYAVQHPEFIPVLIDGLQETKAEVKYGCGKALRLGVEQDPEPFYPYFDTFAEMLDHPNKIYRWQAIYLLAGLTPVDDEDKLDARLDEFFAPITGPRMITAANIVKASATMVKAKPRYATRAVSEILRAERDGRYETQDCYEVVCAAGCNTFYKIRKFVPDVGVLLAFGQRHAGSPRELTANAARKLVNRLEKDFAKA